MLTVAELRARLADVLGDLEQSGPTYVTQRGQARAVLVPVADYTMLLEQLEYLEDSLEVIRAAERRKKGEASRDLDSVRRDVQKRAGRLQGRASAKR